MHIVDLKRKCTNNDLVRPEKGKREIKPPSQGDSKTDKKTRNKQNIQSVCKPSALSSPRPQLRSGLVPHHHGGTSA